MSEFGARFLCAAERDQKIGANGRVKVVAAEGRLVAEAVRDVERCGSAVGAK
ncbi:MAG TPA: hypothetical protein VHC72_15895 [Bryobacteraceae bacterium]|nr:hypothetical protein [Bryobacteraceae bacterium]